MRAILKSFAFQPAWRLRHLSLSVVIAAAAFIPSPSAAAPGDYDVLHEFPGGTDGALGGGEGVVRKGEALYGVATRGGRTTCPGGCGLVYSLTPTADPAVWTKRTIYLFNGGARGYRPRGQLLVVGGSLYGVASRGGNASDCLTFDDTSGCGLIYKITPPATGTLWTQTVLYRFKNLTDGMWPIGGLTIRGATLYGTTSAGGSHHNAGTAFKLSPPAGGQATWTKTNLAEFGGNLGGTPNAAMTFKNGMLYGTTSSGSPDAGTVFELTPPAAARAKWTLKILHRFRGQPGPGGGPPVHPAGGFPAFVAPAFDADGMLYGTASRGAADCSGGPPGCGIVFRLKPPVPPGKAWTFQIIHKFEPGSGFGGPGGAVPVGGVVFDLAGALYGVAMQGGSSGTGVIYKLTPPAGGTAPWSETVLHNNTSSGVPQAPLILRGRFLYGTTAPAFIGAGQVFQLER